MVTMRGNTWVLFLQYSLLVVFAAQALWLAAGSPLEWWLILTLVIAYGVLIFFWPVKKAYIYPFLVTEALLLAALTFLNQGFMFLGFVLGPAAFLLQPRRQAILFTSAAALLFELVIFFRYGWQDVLYPGIVMILGMFSFGYSYYLRDQADDARAETQRVLDELREAHQKLEEYAARVEDLAVMEERNRLARELHDSVKQQSFAASAQLGTARTLLFANPAAAKDHLSKAEALMDEVRSELGQLIHALRPVALQEKGLATALREWGAGWSQQSRILLEVQVQDERSLSLETEQSLFRITQEALSNVARHSRAHKAEMRLIYLPGAVELTLCDDGAGFDLAAVGGGIGLQTMRERAGRLPGGAVEITSAPGHGTRIVVKCSE